MTMRKQFIEKAIVKIEKNVLEVDGQILQLCNISRMEVAPVSKKTDQIRAALGAVLGFFIMFLAHPILGVLILAACLGLLFYITYFVDHSGDHLLIEMNSGTSIYFSSDDEALLLQAKAAINESFHGRAQTLEIDFSHGKTETKEEEDHCVHSSEDDGDQNSISSEEYYSQSVPMADINSEEQELIYLENRITEEIGRMRDLYENDLLAEIKTLLEERDQTGLSIKLKANWSTITAGSISEALGTFAVEILEKFAGIQ